MNEILSESDKIKTDYSEIKRSRSKKIAKSKKKGENNEKIDWIISRKIWKLKWGVEKNDKKYTQKKEEENIPNVERNENTSYEMKNESFSAGNIPGTTEQTTSSNEITTVLKKVGDGISKKTRKSITKTKEGVKKAGKGIREGVNKAKENITKGFTGAPSPIKQRRVSNISEPHVKQSYIEKDRDHKKEKSKNKKNTLDKRNKTNKSFLDKLMEPLVGEPFVQQVVIQPQIQFITQEIQVEVDPNEHFEFGDINNIADEDLQKITLGDINFDIDLTSAFEENDEGQHHLNININSQFLWELLIDY